MDDQRAYYRGDIQSRSLNDYFVKTERQSPGEQYVCLPFILSPVGPK
jgi:hypothetical protein